MAANDTQVAGDHYKNMGVEPWDVIDTWPLEQRIGAYRAGLLKYTMRMGTKDERAQEIAKAGHYAQKLKEVLDEAAINDLDALKRAKEAEVKMRLKMEAAEAQAQPRWKLTPEEEERARELAEKYGLTGGEEG